MTNDSSHEKPTQLFPDLICSECWRGSNFLTKQGDPCGIGDCPGEFIPDMARTVVWNAEQTKHLYARLAAAKRCE